MGLIWAERALTGDGWARDVRVEIGADGRIVGVTAGQLAQGKRVGVLLPAPANAHSHAFQRAMSGLTETRGPDPSDSFWTWRRLMYRFLQHLSPDQVQAITAFAQMEMLEAGFGSSVEFHYLHHQPDGTPYTALAEMSDRIASAAAQSGIGLTLAPVLYMHGGCDGRALKGGQRRFGNDVDQFTRLHQDASHSIGTLPADCRLAVAAHSLRAVPPEALQAAVAMARDGPFHMHLAEQVAEVDEVQAAWGARPVDWLLQNAEVDERWCLIHCTQMTPTETTALAASGAVAGLCPITESNLGDGIFDGARWFGAGGAMAIGSDSDILISVHEELRVLEHSQRLRDRGRAVLASQTQSTGRRMFEAAAKGGAQAAGRGAGVIAPGEWADLLALDGAHVDLEGKQGDALLDAFVFAGRDGMVRDVWSGGRHMVQDGCHVERAAILRDYRHSVGALRAAL